MKATRVIRTERSFLLNARVYLSFAAFAALAVATVAGEGRPRQVQYPKYSPEIIRAPDANSQNDINDQQEKKRSFEAANAERRRQIGTDSAKLLKLALALKSEVDKTDKDTLSIGVIRKADEIEKLAHSVKEKMQLTVGAS